MGVFEFMVGKKKPTPGEVAKERLKVVLVHDRLKVSPETLNLIKKELIGVLSRRLEVDEELVQINLTREAGYDKLQADIPIKRQRVTFDWDPPAYTPSEEVLRGRINIEDDEGTHD